MLFTDRAIKLFNHSGSAETKSREDVDERFKWNLKDIYVDDVTWEKDYNWVLKNLPMYKSFDGKLSSDDDLLVKCLQFDDQIGMKLERLNLYAMLSKDSDMRASKYQGMNDRIKSLLSKALASSSFIRPELLLIPEKRINSFLKKNKDLKIYRHFFNNLLREKKHTLSKEVEEILAMTGEITSAPYGIYSMFTNADMKFPSVKDALGNEFEVSHARFYAAMYNKDRSLREQVFKNYYKPFGDYLNTLTSLFNSNLKSNIFSARARNYNSARNASLDKNNIPESVYDNLVLTVNQNLAPLHRWAAIKKRVLNVDELHPYDVYVTLFSTEKEDKYTYKKAKHLILDALKPLGKNYLNNVKKAFDNRWIDVYETPAKKSGAYSSGTTYGVHPYVLLNWTDLLNDVFTLAHEMGHNMHSYYTGHNQPYPYANYSIFLAEVASTFNESLLLDYLIQHASSNGEKLTLLEKYLNNITSTFFRQVMFAEFEMLVYKRTEAGEALTQNELNELYKEIYQKYWGAEMVIDKEEEYTWARIPHFYYNFYVYQYATGFSASEVLAKSIKEEGKTAVKRYLKFLQAGSSDYSLKILNYAGVDMNSAEPVLATVQKMEKLLDEVESLL